MKRALLILMSLLTAALPMAGLGEITVTEEHFFSIPLYDGSFEAEYFALVTNTGDGPLSLEKGSLVVLSPSGAELYRNDYLSMYPALLAPGETGVLQDSSYGGLSETAEGIGSHVLTLSSGENSYMRVRRLPASARLHVSEDEFWRNVWLEAEVVNESEETVYNPCVVFLLRDALGNFLMAVTSEAYDAGILPGGRILMRKTVRDDVYDYLIAREDGSVTVETFAYTEDYEF